MKEAKALFAMTLIARRSTAWAFDVLSTTAINKGEVRDEAIARFVAEIEDALSILTEPDRGDDASQQDTHK